MANLYEMHLNYLLNLLATNPQVTVFTGMNFTDFPSPTRQQVLNACNAKIDKSKYLGDITIGQVIPVAFPDPSVQYLQGATLGSAGISQSANTQPVVEQNQVVQVIGLNTGPNMNAYVENITARTQVE